MDNKFDKMAVAALEGRRRWMTDEGRMKKTCLDSSFIFPFGLPLLQERANTLLSVLLNGIFGHHGRRALICSCELSGAGSDRSMVRTMRKRAFPAIIFA